MSINELATVLTMKSKLALVSIVGLILVVLVNVIMLLHLQSKKEQVAKPAGTAVASNVSIGGPFSLTDQDSNRVSDSDLRGQYLLIYFGYAHCPDVCPTTLQDMAQALDVLGPDGAAVTPVFVTVDPARDTPDFLKDYVTAFHPRMIGLTGTAEEIKAVAKAYRVYYAKAPSESDEDYLMDHSSYTYLMDRDGKYLSLFRFGASPDEMAEGIRTAVASGG